MYIASEKRKNNVAEYLLYMWQVEDMIRAYNLDIEQIKKNIIEPQHLPEDKAKQLEEWYESLIDMMRREEVTKSGHLQLSKNMIINLVQLHNALLKDPRFPEYTAEFYKTLPYIVELRSKAGENRVGEIETCFTALYGMLMLRLRKQEVTPETEEAIKQITKFIVMLTKNFHLDEQDKLFPAEDNQ